MAERDFGATFPGKVAKENLQTGATQHGTQDRLVEGPKNATAEEEDGEQEDRPELLKPLDAAHSYGFSVEHLESASINIAFGSGVTPQSNVMPLYGLFTSRRYCFQCW